MEIEHRYTAPYHPQTNGKIERFWKTLDEELLTGSQVVRGHTALRSFAVWLASKQAA